jgi:hypothetical protein
MKIVITLFFINFFILIPKLHSQVLYELQRIEKPDYCSKDTLKIKNLIGRKAKIWHDGGIYQTLELSDAYDELTVEIKKKGGKSGWGSYIPKAGDTGTIVHIFSEKKNNLRYIYLLKIGENFIPVNCYYLTDINKPDNYEQSEINYLKDSLKNVNYAAGCKFKLKNVVGGWSRAGLTNIDKISENFSCNLISKGIDTIMLCKYIFDNGSLPIEKAFVVWLDKGKGFVKAFFNNSKHKPTQMKIAIFNSSLLLNYFFTNKIDKIESEPTSEYSISHSLGYSIQVYTKETFFRERLTDFIIRQDKTHPKSLWWKMISEELETVK